MSFLFKTATEVTNSIIGENCYFNGRFYINGSLKIDGKFEGKSLEAEHLYVGPTGKVKTNIFVSSLILEGIIIGNIVARKRVMLLPNSTVLGNITTQELIIQNGVVLEGRCTISHDLKHSAHELIQNDYLKDNLSLENCFGKTLKSNSKK